MTERVQRKQNYPISSTKKSSTTERFIRLVPNLTTMLINNKGTIECSRFRFSALFSIWKHLFNRLYPRKISQVMSALYQSKYNSCQKMRTHFSSLDIWIWEIWYFGSSWVKRSVVKSRGARGAIFQKQNTAVVGSREACSPILKSGPCRNAISSILGDDYINSEDHKVHETQNLMIICRCKGTKHWT
jgi:hypothetical protein